MSFDKASVNKYYHIRDMEDEDEFTEYRNEDFDWNQMRKCLCRPGAIWTLKGNDMLHFSPSDLSRCGEAWYSFICAKVLPTTQVTEVNKDRVALLYDIVMDKSIDMGQVIHTIQESLTGRLSHPSLICGLCKLAKVRWTEDEILQPPKALIDKCMMNCFKIWVGGASHF